MPKAKFQMRTALTLLFLLMIGGRMVHGETIATFVTSVGTMELQLYDNEKPVTVSNFIKYVTSGRFNTNQIIQRWAPNFVIQGGGYQVTNTTNGLRITAIQPFGTITNEYSVGPTFSNTYGTIAMARTSETNSATSQWFLNLTNSNAFLDQVNGGFTVFGRVISGTNVLNLFTQQPSTNSIYSVNIEITPTGEGTPVIGNPTTIDELFASLIYLDIKLRRDVGLAVGVTGPPGREQRVVSWNTIAGVTNTLEYTSTLNPGVWTALTNIVGNGSARGFIDTSKDPERIFRVTLSY